MLFFVSGVTLLTLTTQFKGLHNSNVENLSSNKNFFNAHTKNRI